MLRLGSALTLVLLVTLANTASARAFTETENPANPGVVEVSDAGRFSKVYVISDVHGNFDALIPLLRSAGVIDTDNQWSAGKALLIIDGDSIDKGPRSIDVLDLWRSLTPQAERAGGQLVHLLGNHEAEFLVDPNNSKTKNLLLELKAKGIPVDHLTDLNKPRGAFLRSEPLAAKVGRWIICHSGLFPSMSWEAFRKKAREVLQSGRYNDAFLADDDSILESKNWWKSDARRAALEADLTENQVFGLVFGHLPEAFDAMGKIVTADDGRLIKIDSGLGMNDPAYSGQLLEFTNAKQLENSEFPSALAITSDGHRIRLIP